MGKFGIWKLPYLLSMTSWCSPKGVQDTGATIAVILLSRRELHCPSNKIFCCLQHAEDGGIGMGKESLKGKNFIEKRHQNAIQEMSDSCALVSL